MVARIKCGKSIRGILSYNENKIKTAEAKLLLAAGFPREPHELSFKNKLERFERLTRQNERTKTNAMHIALSFSPADCVDETLLKRIALDYMEQIGFGGQPFLVYQHFDTAHPHLHIATVNIAEGGERIETHNIGKNQSEKARKEIEIAYELVKAEDQQKESSYLLKPGRISATVREVVDTYKFTSLPELNAILRQFGIVAYRGEEGTKMYENGGLVYCSIDEHGIRNGKSIKASAIYSSPTLKNLEKKYGPNEVARKPYGQRLKFLIDRTLNAAVDRNDLEAQLKRHGIRILLRENVQGEVYGVTFIDNATRTVFNGSDLGKAYSAKAFMLRLPPAAKEEIHDATGQSDKLEGSVTNQPIHPASERPVIETWIDIAFSDRHPESNKDPFKRKKKKRLQVE